MRLTNDIAGQESNCSNAEAPLVDGRGLGKSFGTLMALAPLDISIGELVMDLLILSIIIDNLRLN